MTTARETLREAIGARDAAAEALRGEESSLLRVKVLVGEAESQLERHTGLDERVSAHRGAAVAAWAVAGTGAPPHDLTPELSRALRERDQHRAAAEAALDGLAHQTRRRDEAKAALARAEGAVARAAEAVVVDYLAEVEKQWSLIRAEADRLSGILTAGAAVWLAGPGLPVRPISTTPEHRSAVKYIAEAASGALASSMAVPGRHPLTEQLQHWYGRLCRDADAELEPPAEPPAKAA
jgi:hypothetical protein